MGFDSDELEALGEAARHLLDGLGAPAPAEPLTDLERNVLHQTAHELRDNYPYPSPMYAGQMLKPPHRLARLSYALAQLINPNNHALDGGRASSRMERDVVADLARMFGWDAHLGHLTSGGTLANLEALWVAGRLHPGAPILASDQAHYTHGRITGVLGLPFDTVPTDSRGRMRPEDLDQRLRSGRASCVVVTAGTTGLGAVDPIHELASICREHGVRMHVDAAYGGFFHLVRDRLDASARAAFEAITQADSIVVDPHKHGLQPYGCGCIMFKDPGVGRLYRHDSPYTYFTSEELHLGEISLECSRAGAAAVALWATLRAFPLTADGVFARGLSQCLDAARSLHARLSEAGWQMVPGPELDIVVWAPPGVIASEIDAASRRVFEAAAAKDLHLALIRLPRKKLAAHWSNVMFDVEEVTCLRSTLMKWEHVHWVDQIFSTLQDCRV